jgi:phage tail-like protein
MAGGVTWTRPNVQKNNKGVGDFNQAHRFTVEMDGVLVGGIHTVEGIEHETEVIEAHDGENHETQFAPGRQKPGVIKFTKDFTSTKEFITWRQTVIDGKTQRKTVSVVLLTPDGTESIRYNFYEMWPSKYIGPSLNARNSANATESIECRFERMEMK